MAKFWETLGEKLADRWLQVSVPALVFWYGVALAWLADKGTSEAGRQAHKFTEQPTALQVVIVLSILIAIAASGVLVQALSIPVQRLMEGYWPPFLSPIRRRAVARIQRRNETEQQAYYQYYARMQSSPNAETALHLARLERRRKYMPARYSALMPTRFGNALKVAEERATTLYGLVPEVLWPHLRQLLPESLLQDFEESQKKLKGTVERIVWALLFTGFGYFAWWPPVIGILIVVFSYLVLPSRAYVLADLAAVSWDLHRVELYKKLRWPVPENPGDEISRGARLTSYIARGWDENSPTFTEPV